MFPIHVCVCFVWLQSSVIEMLLDVDEELASEVYYAEASGASQQRQDVSSWLHYIKVI